MYKSIVNMCKPQHCSLTGSASPSVEPPPFQPLRTKNCCLRLTRGRNRSSAPSINIYPVKVCDMTKRKTCRQWKVGWRYALVDGSIACTPSAADELTPGLHAAAPSVPSLLHPAMPTVRLSLLHWSHDRNSHERCISEW